MTLLLVALNYQTWDKALRVNEALFAQNGRCGYVLKPAHLRAAGSARVAEQEAWLVKIRVISGQTIPKAGQGDGGEVVDPYVVVKVYGHPNEKQKKKSNPVKNNGKRAYTAYVKVRNPKSTGKWTSVALKVSHCPSVRGNATSVKMLQVLKKKKAERVYNHLIARKWVSRRLLALSHSSTARRVP